MDNKCVRYPFSWQIYCFRCHFSIVTRMTRFSFWARYWMVRHFGGHFEGRADKAQTSENAPSASAWIVAWIGVAITSRGRWAERLMILAVSSLQFASIIVIDILKELPALNEQLVRRRARAPCKRPPPPIIPRFLARFHPLLRNLQSCHVFCSSDFLLLSLTKIMESFLHYSIIYARTIEIIMKTYFCLSYFPICLYPISSL